MKLYTNNHGNLFAQIALVAADLSATNVEVCIIDKQAEDYKEFAKKHATGKFPLLELDSGELLFESSAIALHFARESKSGLLGSSPFEEA
jgi:glutathione S-transferase